MSGTGNPYLEAYAQAEHLYGSPVGVKPRRARRAARLKKLMELRDRAVEAEGAQASFTTEPAPEPTEADRLAAELAKPYTEAIKSGVMPTPEAVEAFGRSNNPELLRVELAAREKHKEDEKKFWAALEAGDDDAINDAIPYLGKSWEEYRTQEAGVKKFLEQLKSLDPADPQHQQIILAARGTPGEKGPIEQSADALAEWKKRLEEIEAKINTGIERRKAGGFAAAKELGKYKFGTWKGESIIAGSLAKIGHALQHFQRGVAGQIGATTDILQGRINKDSVANAIPFVAQFTESGQTRGELAGKQWAKTMAPAFKPAATVTQAVTEAGEATYNPGAIAYGHLIDMVAGVEKPEGMSDEEWEKSGRHAARKEKFPGAAAQLVFETGTDPLTYVNLPVTKVLGKALKPIEPLADKLSAKFGVKWTAGKIRAKLIGGAPLEDPMWLKQSLAADAAKVDAAAPFVEEAFKAEDEITRKLMELPPEIQPEAQRLVAPLRELKGRDVPVDVLQEGRAELLRDIPPEHRSAILAYTELVADKSELRKIMEARVGIGAELADDITMGYAERRFTPELRAHIAQHPEIRETLRDLKLAQGNVARGEQIPATNQFATRKFREQGFEEAEDVLRKQYKWDRDVWSRDQAAILRDDFLFAAEAAKRRADADQFIKVFGAKPTVAESQAAIDAVVAATGRRAEIGRAIRSKAETKAKEAITAHERADFEGMSVDEKANVIRQALERAGIKAPEGHISTLDFMRRINMKLPKDPKFWDEIAELATTWIPESRIKEFTNIHAKTTPTGWRAQWNRITNWAARALLTNPASLSKDIKGQIINLTMTDPAAVKYLDESWAIVKRTRRPDKDAAELIAAGLDRPYFESEITPSTIAATAEFGGSKVAGAIEESGFTGASLRGIGKLAQKVPGLRTIGRGLESTGKGVGKVGRALLTARQETESAFRIATYKAAKARGLSRAEALQEVAKYWGNFSELSKLETNVLKGFVLFYAWQLRSLPIAMRHILDHPLRTRLFLTLAAGNVSDDETFPAWARRLGGSTIGRDAAGNPRFISGGVGSYFDTLGDVLQGEAAQRLRTDGLSGVPEGIAHGTLRRLHPLIQAPLEYATNYDSFSGNKIRLEPGDDTAKTRLTDHGPAAALWLPKGLREMLGVETRKKPDGSVDYVRVDPTWNWLFNKVTPGAGAMLSSINPLADPRKEAWEAASRAFFGTPTYSIRSQDLEDRMRDKVRQAREQLRKELPGSGLAMSTYGTLYFDKGLDRGREMAEDNERWKAEAKARGYSEAAYLRLKMGAKYDEALRLLDFGNYLLHWDDALAYEGLPARGLGPASKDATEPLRKLGARHGKAHALRGPGRR